MQTEREYKDHYVAFLDILGFKSYLARSSCSEIHAIFDILRKKTNRELNLNGVQIEAFKHIRYTILSDSIIVYIDSSIDDAFAALLDVCGGLQLSLANREEPILLRGGIAKGGLFVENDIIYGEGLVRAYLLESNLSKYPRIIFSGETLAAGEKNTKYMFTQLDGIISCHSLDEDHFYYVEYLISCSMRTPEAIKYYDRLLALCKSFLDQANDHSLREKYLWLKKKVDYAIKIRVDVGSYYKKQQEEEYSRKTDEYNARFSIYNKHITAQIMKNDDDPSAE